MLRDAILGFVFTKKKILIHPMHKVPSAFNFDKPWPHSKVRNFFFKFRLKKFTRKSRALDTRQQIAPKVAEHSHSFFNQSDIDIFSSTIGQQARARSANGWGARKSNLNRIFNLNLIIYISI